MPRTHPAIPLTTTIQSNGAREVPNT
jgi:hypothetical protein